MTNKDEYREIQLEIQGMTWTGWEPKVVQALEGLEGVKKATASHPEKKAIVVYDTTSVTLEHMQNALLKAGYVASFSNNEKCENLKLLSGVKNAFQSVFVLSIPCNWPLIWKDDLLGIPEEAFDFGLLPKSGDFVIIDNFPNKWLCDRVLEKQWKQRDSIIQEIIESW